MKSGISGFGGNSLVNRTQALIKRLNNYWKLEAINVLLVPALMLFFSGGVIGLISLLAMAAMCGLLMIGAYFWWAMLQVLRSSQSIDRHLKRIAALESPMLILTVCAVICASASWIWKGLSIGLADSIVASIAATLAAPEFVNYYHRQLQHFDHRADFQRLLSGKGFRKSQLRGDLERLGLR